MIKLGKNVRMTVFYCCRDYYPFRNDANYWCRRQVMRNILEPVKLQMYGDIWNQVKERYTDD